MSNSASNKKSPGVRLALHESQARANPISPYSSTSRQESRQRKRVALRLIKRNAGEEKQPRRISLDEFRRGINSSTSIQFRQPLWPIQDLLDALRPTKTYRSTIVVSEKDLRVVSDWPKDYDHLDRARQLLWDGDEDNYDSISESSEGPEDVFPKRSRFHIAPKKRDVQLDVELPSQRKAQMIIRIAEKLSTSQPNTGMIFVLLVECRYHELRHADQSVFQTEDQDVIETVGNVPSSKHFKSRLLSPILDFLKNDSLNSCTLAYIASPSNMYSSRQRGRTHFRSNSMPRVRMPSQIPESYLQTLRSSIPPPKTHERSTRRNGRKSSPRSTPNTSRPQQEGQDSATRQPPTLRRKKTAKALWKEAKSASAPRRARITLTIVSINAIVVGKFRLTPRGERKLKKLCKAISRDKRRHLQDFLEAKKAKKRKTTKRRAERLAKWNLQKRFDVLQEFCAGSPGFNGGFPDRGEEGWSPSDSSDDSDNDGDLSDMIEERRAADSNYHPDTPFNMGGGAQEEEDLQDTDNLNLPDPGTEVVLRISLDWQNMGFRYERELRVVFPAFSFWPDLSGTSGA